MAFQSGISLRDTLEIIDSMFPGMDTVEATIVMKLPRAYMAHVAAILKLLKHIPLNMVVRDVRRAEFVAATAVLESKLKEWKRRKKESFLEYVPGLGDRHPIGLIRRALVASIQDDCETGERKQFRRESPKV